MKKIVTPRVSVAKVSVSESNILKASARLLSAKLVSTEIAYVQRSLGNTATQTDLDAKVVAVRGLPWASIALPE